MPSGMIIRIIGATADKIDTIDELNYTADQQFIIVLTLTPTNKRNDDNVLGCDLNKDND